MATDCVFCKVIAKELPAHIIAEDDDCIVFEDIAPKAPVHYLIVPKKHITNLHDIGVEDIPLMGKLMLMAKKIASKLPEPKAFGLIINNGEDAGQSVFHLHGHFLSGKKMTDL
jgi:histidine triad (HIT) family protein